MKAVVLGFTWRMVLLFTASVFLWLNPSIAKAKQEKEKAFEVFDGQVYNGKYYPRMDIIEWTENGHTQSSMEFQVYWKGHQVEMSFELEEKDGKKVMLVHYFIPERNEHLCRRVLAPHHFTKNFMVYRDTRDKDMDNTIVTMLPIEEKPGRSLISGKKYLACLDESEERSMPQANDRMPAANENAGEGTNHTPVAREAVTHQNEGQTATAESESVTTSKKKERVGGGISKSGVSVPFGDL